MLEKNMSLPILNVELSKIVQDLPSYVWLKAQWLWSKNYQKKALKLALRRLSRRWAPNWKMGLSRKTLTRQMSSTRKLLIPQSKLRTLEVAAYNKPQAKQYLRQLRTRLAIQRKIFVHPRMSWTGEVLDCTCLDSAWPQRSLEWFSKTTIRPLKLCKT